MELPKELHHRRRYRVCDWSALLASDVASRASLAVSRIEKYTKTVTTPVCMFDVISSELLSADMNPLHWAEFDAQATGYRAKLRFEGLLFVRGPTICYFPI